MNLRDQILAAKDLKVSEIEIPEWGVTVFASELCAGDFDKVMSAHDKEEAHVAVATSIILGIKDENDELVFTHDDIDALMTKSAGVLERLYKEVMKLSGLDLDDKGKTQAEKTLPAPHSSGMTTE